MEETQNYNNDTSPNTPMEQQPTPTGLRDAQNNITKNDLKQGGVIGERKRTRRKKDTTSVFSQESSVQFDAKADDDSNVKVVCTVVHDSDDGSNNNVPVLTKVDNNVRNGSGTESKDANHVSRDQSQTAKQNALEAASSTRKNRLNTVRDNSRSDTTMGNFFDKTTDDNEGKILLEKMIALSSTGERDNRETTENAKEETTEDAKSERAKDATKKTTEDAKNKRTATHRKCTYSSINYEFHEANHAIIDTFAVSLDLSVHNNNGRVYCLVCDMTIQAQNDGIQKYLCRHIRSKKHVHELSAMIEDDKRSKNNGEFSSKLALAREYLVRTDDSVKCILCNSDKEPRCKINNNEQALREHVSSNAHRDAKVSWELPIKNMLQQIHKQFRCQYNAKLYSCKFCNYQSPSEFNYIKHLHVPYHVMRLIEIPNHPNKFKFYFCKVCRILWFGSVETSDQHYEEIQHKQTEMYGSDILDFPEQVAQVLTKPGENAEILLQRSNYVKHDGMIKHFVLHSFESDLRIYIPNIRAYLFGSRVSDLAFPESDIDIFLDCYNMYEGKNSSYHKTQDLITLIVHYLSRNGRLWSVHNVILHSRTPIAKVRHVPTGVICDISVTNGLAVENTKMIRYFNHAFPLCRKLILFLKQWLHLSGLLGSHLVTSYALTWCVIFYLQSALVFPSISDLIKLKNKSWLISGWEVGVSHDFRINKVDYTFEELLFGFFLFYADFKYRRQVICPLLGRPISKKSFAKISELPQDMATYVAYIRTTVAQEEPPQPFFISPLCVQDPFDLSHNLTKAVNHKELKSFCNNCATSAKMLKTNLPSLTPPAMWPNL